MTVSRDAYIHGWTRLASSGRLRRACFSFLLVAIAGWSGGAGGGSNSNSGIVSAASAEVRGSCGNAAAPAFVGFAALGSIVDGPDGPCSILDIYGVFSATFYVVDRIENSLVVLSGGFEPVVHAPDPLLPDWSPQLSPPDGIDSFLTIGGSPGPGNVTIPDSAWGIGGFQSLAIPPGAGWQNGQPIILQGKANDVPMLGPATLLGRFVICPAAHGPVTQLTMSASIVFGTGPGTPETAVTTTLAASFPIWAPSADLNGDGTVDGADLGILLTEWASESGAADLNGDGIVDGADLGLLLAAWQS